jgi:hypothetical protein
MTELPLAVLPARCGSTEPLAVIASYPSLAGLRLHSLATAIEYLCAVCAYVRESTVVATDDVRLVCPKCFARLSYEDTAAQVPLPRTSLLD